MVESWQSLQVLVGLVRLLLPTLTSKPHVYEFARIVLFEEHLGKPLNRNYLLACNERLLLTFFVDLRVFVVFVPLAFSC